MCLMLRRRHLMLDRRRLMLYGGLNRRLPNGSRAHAGLRRLVLHLRGIHDDGGFGARRRHPDVEFNRAVDVVRVIDARHLALHEDGVAHRDRSAELIKVWHQYFTTDPPFIGLLIGAELRAMPLAVVFAATEGRKVNLVVARLPDIGLRSGPVRPLTAAPFDELMFFAIVVFLVFLVVVFLFGIDRFLYGFVFSFDG